MASLHQMEQDQRAMMVRLWDIGPSKPGPVPPKPPQGPAGKEGDPEFEIAMISFHEELVEYKEKLHAYRDAKKKYAAWHEHYGGPYEITMWSTNAHDALTNDPHRYWVSDARLKNHGLPVPLKPGRWHEETLRRIAAGEEEAAEVRRRDPVFGQEEVRP